MEENNTDDDELADNVICFATYKINRLIDEMTAIQRFDIVEVLSNALESYERGDIAIKFRNGWPIIADPNEESDMQD